MKYPVKWSLKLAAGLILNLLMTACSTIGIQPLTAEQSVRTRAAERWQALIEGKLETAYSYETPEYRKLFTYQQYESSKHGVGLWTKAEVMDVACKEICVVSMQIHVTMRPARWGDTIETSSLLKEQWTRDKDSGEWFHLSSK